MKRNANYEINFTTNTITVTRQFLQAASVLGTTEFATMQQLRDLKMPITMREIHRKKTETKWGFARMENYLKHLANSDQHLEAFTTMKEAFPHATVWKWFKTNYPNYCKVPVLNSSHRIIAPSVSTVTENTAKRLKDQEKKEAEKVAAA